MAQLDAVLKSLTDIREFVKGETADLRGAIDKVKLDAERALAEMQDWRRQFVNPGSPITKEQGEYASQRGGVFGGKFQVPYRKMISLPASNPVLSPVDREQLRALQDLHDAVVLRYYFEKKKAPKHADVNYIVGKVADSVDFKMYSSAMIRAGYAKAANDILNPAGGDGQYLDFTLLSAQMIDLIRLEAVVASQFRTIPLSRAKQDFPALRSDTRAVLGGGVSLPEDDLTGIGATPPAGAIMKPGFNEVSFSAVHCLGFIPWTDDMFEDSIVPLLPQLREQASIAIARAKDGAVINGATGTHIDSDTSSPHFSTAWNGLRKLGLTNQGVSIGAEITTTDVNKLMRIMGKYAKRTSDQVLFLSVIDWLKIRNDTDLKTMDKAGMAATLQNGHVDRIFNVPIVVTEEVRRDLNASGVYDGVTTDNTTEILCNRSRFWLGQKNEMDIEQVRVPQALANWLQVDVRVDFKAIDLNSGVSVFPAGEAPVAIGYNVTV